MSHHLVFIHSFVDFAWKFLNIIRVVTELCLHWSLQSNVLTLALWCTFQYSTNFDWKILSRSVIFIYTFLFCCVLRTFVASSEIYLCSLRNIFFAKVSDISEHIDLDDVIFTSMMAMYFFLKIIIWEVENTQNKLSFICIIKKADFVDRFYY